VEAPYRVKIETTIIIGKTVNKLTVLMLAVCTGTFIEMAALKV
jgi:hypothetical protein